MSILIFFVYIFVAFAEFYQTLWDLNPDDGRSGLLRDAGTAVPDCMASGPWGP
jgi:hypothetical protein